MAQLMPLPLTTSCSSKSRLVLPFWYQFTWTKSIEPQNGCSVVVCKVFKVCDKRMMEGGEFQTVGAAVQNKLERKWYGLL